jgi:hypothetical protein
MPQSTGHQANGIALGDAWEGHSDRVPALSRPCEPMEWLRFKSARQTETEAAPIRYWAELVGTDTDSRKISPHGSPGPAPFRPEAALLSERITFDACCSQRPIGGAFISAAWPKNRSHRWRV